MRKCFKPIKDFLRDFLRVGRIFLALPFLWVALFAPNTMLAQNAEGFEVVFCDAHLGVQTLWMDEYGNLHKQKPQEDNNCGWAFAKQIAEQKISTLLLASGTITDTANAPSLSTQIWQSHVTHIHSARAPPFSFG